MGNKINPEEKLFQTITLKVLEKSKGKKIKDKQFLCDKIYPFSLFLPLNDTQFAIKTLEENSKEGIILESSTITEKNICDSEVERQLQINYGKNFMSNVLSKETLGYYFSDDIIYDIERAYYIKVGNNKLCRLYNSVILQIGKINLEKTKLKLDEKEEKSLKAIMTSNQSEEEIIKNLISKLRTIGYIVPLQIKLGGKLIVEYDSNNFSEAKEMIQYIDNQSKLQCSFVVASMKTHSSYNFQNNGGFFSDTEMNRKIMNKNSNIKFLGGNISSGSDFTNLGRWYLSLNNENMSIIGYDSFITIDEIFSEELKEIYQKYKSQIVEKFKRNEILFNICKLAVLKKKEGLVKAVSSRAVNLWENGVTTPTEYVKECIIDNRRVYEFFTSGSILFVEKKLNPNHIYVGWKILSRWKDGTNGRWMMLQDPLLNNNCKFEFHSQFCRGQSWWVHLYYVEFD